MGAVTLEWTLISVISLTSLTLYWSLTEIYYETYFILVGHSADWSFQCVLYFKFENNSVALFKVRCLIRSYNKFNVFLKLEICYKVIGTGTLSTSIFEFIATNPV